MLEYSCLSSYNYHQRITNIQVTHLIKEAEDCSPAHERIFNVYCETSCLTDFLGNSTIQCPWKNLKVDHYCVGVCVYAKFLSKASREWTFNMMCDSSQAVTYTCIGLYAECVCSLVCIDGVIYHALCIIHVYFNILSAHFEILLIIEKQ